MSKEYEDIEYCGLCKKDTQQLIYDSEHERDSSNDWRVCLECNGYYSRYLGKWEKENDSTKKLRM